MTRGPWPTCVITLLRHKSAFSFSECPRLSRPDCHQRASGACRSIGCGRLSWRDLTEDLSTWARIGPGRRRAFPSSRSSATGLFAAALGECLAFASQAQEPVGSRLWQHWSTIRALARPDFGALTRNLRRRMKKICLDMMAEIRRLDPKAAEPGFETGSSRKWWSPDVSVRPSSDGGMNVELKPGNPPRVLVNRPISPPSAARCRKKRPWPGIP